MLGSPSLQAALLTWAAASSGATAAAATAGSAGDTTLDCATVVAEATAAAATAVAETASSPPATAAAASSCLTGLFSSSGGASSSSSSTAAAAAPTVAACLALASAIPLRTHPTTAATSTATATSTAITATAVSGSSLGGSAERAAPPPAFTPREAATLERLTRLGALSAPGTPGEPLTASVTWSGDADDAAPLLVALALARGSAGCLRLQLITPRGMGDTGGGGEGGRGGGTEAAAKEAVAAARLEAWRAWACAAGAGSIEISVVRWPPPPRASPPFLAQLLVLLPPPPRGTDADAMDMTDGGDFWHGLVDAAVTDGGLVLGVASTAPAASTGAASAKAKVVLVAAATPPPSPPYAFLSGRAEALQLHLRAPQQRALSGHGCAACEAEAAAFFGRDCAMSPDAVVSPWLAASSSASAAASGFGGGGALALSSLFLELAAAWPLGYRLEERCHALAAFLGVGVAGASSASSVGAMCRYHGCVDSRR
tara:strand:- start:111 stop:1568 length:1458 start_codon:yes stop_codon:yes gene_type:complete